MTRTLWTSSVARRVSLALLLEPRDAWWGVYWTTEANVLGERLVLVYVCLLPFLPLRVSLLFNRWPLEDADETLSFEELVQIAALCYRFALDRSLLWDGNPREPLEVSDERRHTD